MCQKLALQRLYELYEPGLVCVCVSAEAIPIIYRSPHGYHHAENFPQISYKAFRAAGQK